MLLACLWKQTFLVTVKTKHLCPVTHIKACPLTVKIKVILLLSWKHFQ